MNKSRVFTGRKGSKNTDPKVIQVICFVKATNENKSSQWVHDYVKRHARELFISGKTIPVARTVHKIISENSNQISDIKEKTSNSEYLELEKPWTIGSCIEHDIPSEFIGNLLTLQKENREFETLDGEKYPLITIREARWFCKLYPFLYPRIKTQSPDNIALHTGIVAVAAKAYAFNERIAEILDKNGVVDTSELDGLLQSENLPAAMGLIAKEYTYSDKAMENAKKDGE